MFRRGLRGTSSDLRLPRQYQRGGGKTVARAKICKTRNIISILFFVIATVRLQSYSYSYDGNVNSINEVRISPSINYLVDDTDISCVDSLLENKKAVIANSSMKDNSTSFRILLHPRSKDKYITRKIQSNGLYEPEMEDFIALAFPKNESNDVGGANSFRPWALDLGANVGFHSLHMAKRGANVISFEPAPDTAELVKCSAKLLGAAAAAKSDESKTSGSITVVQAGASDIDFQAKMLRHADSPGMTTFGNNSNFPMHELETADESMIQLFRAQDVLSSFGVPEGRSEYLRLAKVDVEGFELRALRGLNLTRFPFHFLTFEFFPAMLRASGAEPADLLTLVRDAGYKCDHDKHSGNTRDEMNSWINGIKSHVNVFCKLSE